MSVDVVVLTSDKYLWAMRPFAFLFNKYWSTYQNVIVGGFTPPTFALPNNFRFISIDKEDYPANRWSDGLIKLLNMLDSPHIVLMLEDYWICRTVDHGAIGTLSEYMHIHPEILRCDLTTDRLYNGHMKEVGFWGHYDIIETPAGSEYQFSTQAGIWNRVHLLSQLIPGRSPWETEIYTSPPESLRVIGTRQNPVRYANAILKGEIDYEQLKQIQPEHRWIIDEMISKKER